MSVEVLLTIIGLALAVYTVLPAERRLDINLRMSKGDWAIALGALGLVHYITFYPVLSQIGLAPDLGPWRWGFRPDTASYLILLVASGIVWIRARRASVRPAKVPVFSALALRLLHEGRHGDLLLLARSFQVRYSSWASTPLSAPSPSDRSR